MARSNFSHVRVAGVVGVVPEGVIRIDDELEFYGGDEKLLARNKEILGLGTRHVVDDRTTNCDLCQAAAERLLTGMGVDRKSVDALIVASFSHDYHYPASACILQARLGLSPDCACYDQGGLGCTAYVYALWQAHALVGSGAVRRCLVLAGDVNSIHSSRRNRNVNMLFGDAATATLVERTADETPSWFCLGTDGSGWKAIVAPAGGYNLPVREDIACLEVTDADGNPWHLWEVILKGMDVFRFTTVAGPKSIAEVLSAAGKTIDDIDYFAIHQANRQIVRSVAAYAGLPSGKYSSEAFTVYGNCASAAVVTDVLRALSQGAVGSCCLATFGVGLSWASAVVDLSKVWNGGMMVYRRMADAPSREEEIREWIRFYKGED